MPRGLALALLFLSLSFEARAARTCVVQTDPVGGACNGCCDGSGCEPGDSGVQCGVNGNSCQTCDPGTEVCLNQQCVPLLCLSCQGCCPPDSGMCVLSNSPAAGTCMQGVCIGCSAGNCGDGCCDVTGACQRGQPHDTACGLGGEQCLACTPGFCILDGGSGSCAFIMVADAGHADAGRAVDAGPEADAGSGSDGGVVAQGLLRANLGCGCSSGMGLAAMLAFALAVSHRRRPRL
jgi:uncharacterized protein (TIGR03382 family)